MGLVLQRSHGTLQNYFQAELPQINTPTVTMLKELLLIALVAGVAQSVFLCKHSGMAFKCFENAPDTKVCLTNGAVVCGNCKTKYEYCKSNGGVKPSKSPASHCGKDWESKPCDSAVGATY